MGAPNVTEQAKKEACVSAAKARLSAIVDLAAKLRRHARVKPRQKPHRVFYLWANLWRRIRGAKDGRNEASSAIDHKHPNDENAHARSRKRQLLKARKGGGGEPAAAKMSDPACAGLTGRAAISMIGLMPAKSLISLVPPTSRGGRIPSDEPSWRGLAIRGRRDDTALRFAVAQ